MLAQENLFHTQELRDTSVQVCRHISVGGSPVMHVIRGGSGNWIFLCSRDHGEDALEGIALPLQMMIEADPSLHEVSTLAPHDFASRSALGQPWEFGDQLSLEIPECIKKYGWFVALVGDDTRANPEYFSYTIGMPTTQGHPELLLLGQSPEMGPRILNTLGARIAKGHRIAPETGPETIIGTSSIRCKNLHPTWYRDFLGYALWYHGDENFPVMQVFCADENGRFPWESDCNPLVTRLQPDLSLPKQ